MAMAGDTITISKQKTTYIEILREYEVFLQ